MPFNHKHSFLVTPIFNFLDLSLQKIYGFLVKLKSLSWYISCLFKHKIRIDKKRIQSFKNLHHGEVIYILASGPSATIEKLKYLDNKVVIAIALSYIQFGFFKPKKQYWFTSDELRVEETSNVDRSQFDAAFRVLKLFPNHFINSNNSFTRTDIVLFGVQNNDPNSYKSFSHDLSKKIIPAGATSIFGAIQLAAYMGARKIVLVGADFGAPDKEKTNFKTRSLLPQEVVRYSKVCFDDYWKNKYNNYIEPTLIIYKKILSSRNINLINVSDITRDRISQFVNIRDVEK
jgi:hypothetical protein